MNVPAQVLANPPRTSPPGSVLSSDGVLVPVPQVLLQFSQRIRPEPGAPPFRSTYSAEIIRAALARIQEMHAHAEGRGHGLIVIRGELLEAARELGFSHLVDYLPCQSSLPLVPFVELQRNDGEDGRPMWISIDGVVFDVTKYRKVHPGGIVIDKAVGRDATQCFLAHHGRKPGSKVWERLRTLAVGRLSEADAARVPYRYQPSSRADESAAREARLLQKLRETIPGSAFGGK